MYDQKKLAVFSNNELYNIIKQDANINKILQF